MVLYLPSAWGFRKTRKPLECKDAGDSACKRAAGNDGVNCGPHAKPIKGIHPLFDQGKIGSTVTVSPSARDLLFFSLLHIQLRGGCGGPSAFEAKIAPSLSLSANTPCSVSTMRGVTTYLLGLIVVPQGEHRKGRWRRRTASFVFNGDFRANADIAYERH